MNKRNRSGFVRQKVTQHSKVNVNRLWPPHSDSVHFPDATNKGTHSLLGYYKTTTKPSQVSCWEMLAGIDKSLTVSLWDCCGLAHCQNRILFKLKIYWFKFRKTLLCCFYNQIRGWGNFDLYFFFFLWHLIWVWEGTIFSKLVLRTKVSKHDDYHFLWITVHVKSWACYMMQKQLKGNKQKYLFAYINFVKISVGRKRGNTQQLTTA